MNYPEVYSRLNFELGIVIFIKKNGEFRVMLCTRCMSIINMVFGYKGNVLASHDNRCNIGNGNVAVYDMAIEDARCFNINRVIDIQWLGPVENKEQYDKMFAEFVEFRDNYLKACTATVDFDNISTQTKSTTEEGAGTTEEMTEALNSLFGSGASLLNENEGQQKNVDTDGMA